ncbi:putative phosphotransferase [Anaeramoeba flamelloides]|uniref:2'-phosphotransferase n=1 Tax=Anaeramoeba flamelloides TaxID=1746091 RepID=A0AAV7YGA4_9EUKA|nr:putative phosphotransferase [Anaeramoeba flamelloides]
MSNNRNKKRGRGRGRGRRYSPDEQISRSLSYHLRHNKSLELDPQGYYPVSKILLLDGLTNFVEEDVKRCVASNKKQRFKLKEEDNILYIKANQGHSRVIEKLELTPITNKNIPPICVHGTYRNAFNKIKQKGLSKMKRTHIHFAPNVPGKGEVISGMRQNCPIQIFINVEMAMNDGIKFFQSENKVILTTGNEEGFLLKKYFLKVVETKTNKKLQF